MAKTGIILLLVFLEQVYSAEFSCEGSTRGQNFVIVFTGNYYLSPERTELNLTVVTFSDAPTTVTIRSQLIFDGFPYNKSFEVEPKGSRRIPVPVKFLLDNRSGRYRKVLELNSDKDVSVYGENYYKMTADGFLAIPIKSLGKTYVAMSYEDGENFDFPSVFAIVGVADNTSAMVTLSTTVLYDSKWYYPGSNIIFSIDRGEVVQLVSNPYNESLGGSIVNSDKPVAVFGGHLCAHTEDSSCDMLTEQVLPVKSWEQTHIYSATGSPEDVSTYVIYAYYENTVVGIPGYDTIILQRGEVWQGDITGSGVIHSSHPTSVMQVLKTIKGRTVDPSLIQVSAEQHFGYKFGFPTPPKSGYGTRGYYNFLNIVVKINESGTILLNNKPMQNASILNTHVIPGTPYEVFIVEIPMGEGVYFVEQTSVHNTAPLSVIVYGYNYQESYGYSAGLTLRTNQTVLDFDPFFLRETGGEQIIVALPDLEDDTPPVQNASCRFVTKLGREINVKAYPVDFNSFSCLSPRFDEVGYIGVKVSLDSQYSFPFRGNLYVAPQDVLLPTLRVYQDSIAESIINFSANLPVTIEWDLKELYPVDELTLIIQVASRQNNESISWSDDILIATGIENNGSFTFVPLNLDQHKLDKIGHFGTSSIVFVLRPSVPDVCCLSSVSSGFLILLGSTECLKWLNELQFLRPGGIQHCPCTSNQAMFDSNFQRDVNWDLNYFQKGSTSCFLSNIGLGSSGQQCCYKADGNILVGPPGGGSADAVVLGNSESMGTIWHYFYDVLPWISCCKLSDSCDTYYKYRPSDDCSLYVPPRSSGGTGDPHLKSLDGKEYTFNGAGEFLLVKSWLYDTILQARMEILPGTNSSVFTAFVISSNESASVQVQRTMEYNNLVLIDGVPVEFYRDYILVYRQDLKGLRLEVNEDFSEVLILLHSGVALVVRIDLEMMSYILQLPVKFKGAVEGLLGNFNDNPNDDFTMPNMSVLSPNSSLVNIHFDFGLSWMIDKNSTLFRYFAPYDYSSFAKPDFIPVLEYPDKSDLSDDAKTLCGNCAPCIFDAASTGSLSFANKTLQEIQLLETVLLNLVQSTSCGYPGEVENGYINGNTYLIGYNITIFCYEGYLLKGPSVITCQKDGNWSSSLPTCSIVPTFTASPTSIATTPPLSMISTMTTSNVSPTSSASATITTSNNQTTSVGKSTFLPSISPGTTSDGSPTSIVPTTMSTPSVAPTSISMSSAESTISSLTPTNVTQASSATTNITASNVPTTSAANFSSLPTISTITTSAVSPTSTATSELPSPNASSTTTARSSSSLPTCSTLTTFDVSPNIDFTTIPMTSDSELSTPKTSRKGVIIGCSLIFVAVLIIVVVFFIVRKPCKRSKANVDEHHLTQCTVNNKYSSLHNGNT